MKIKSYVSLAAGALGGLFGALFGAWSADLVTLLCFMAADFITGICVALIFKKSAKSSSGGLDSRACYKGLIRKCVILLIVGMAHRLDVSLGATYVRSAVIVAFISSEGISIVENASLMGVPLPKIVRASLDVLSQKSQKSDDEKEDGEDIFGVAELLEEESKGEYTDSKDPSHKGD